MLIKVTNFCSMGCSHCMEDSTVQGGHMTRETFLRALDFTRRIEEPVWSVVAPRILLSGGECTEHPDFLWFLEEVERQRLHPLIITNGMWLSDAKLRDAILRPSRRNLLVQVTNDKRFYPHQPVRVSDPRIVYVDSLTKLVPLGRLGRKRGPFPLPMSKAPTSFNLRSLTRGMGSFASAVQALRIRAATGVSGNCTPNISETGDVLAGETRLCYKVGTVDSTDAELTAAVFNMRCNACGLVTNLPDSHKAAIGEL
jgi:hypothetical protein